MIWHATRTTLRTLFRTNSRFFMIKVKLTNLAHLTLPSDALKGLSKGPGGTPKAEDTCTTERKSLGGGLGKGKDEENEEGSSGSQRQGQRCRCLIGERFHSKKGLVRVRAGSQSIFLRGTIIIFTIGGGALEALTLQNVTPRTSRRPSR